MNSRFILILSRIIITPLFFYSGIGKVINFTDNVMKTPFGDSFIGQIMIISAIFIEIGGSVLFISGYKIKETCLLWVLYILLTSVMFHQFWAFTGPQQVSQIIQFSKNLSIVSGLLGFYLYYSGRPLTVSEGKK